MFFGIFPHMLGTLAGVEKCQTIRKLHLVVWDFVSVIFFLKLGFWQIDVFTKYCCCNSSKRPQMPQKWIRTILFGSGYTLDTLNRGLGPFFAVFITLFAAGGSVDPLAPPWTPSSKCWYQSSKYWYLSSNYWYISSKYQYLASKYQYIYPQNIDIWPQTINIWPQNVNI